VEEHELEALFDEVTGLSLKPVFDLAVRGTRDLPLSEVLAAFGIEMNDRRKGGKASLNVRTQRDGSDCKLASVHEGGPAHKAGLSAGDVLVAIDGLRVTASNLDGLLQRYQPDVAVEVYAFRRDELIHVNLTLADDAAPQFTLTPREKPVAGARLRVGWLKTLARARH
jgi:predicted metalloprotease with PDZ domain